MKNNALDERFYYLLQCSDKNSLALDAGCGDLYFAKYTTKNNKKVVFTDMFRPPEDKLMDYEFIQTSINKLPFEDNYFDFIYCLGVLQYNSNDAEAMSEFSRVLKPGGTLLLTLPTAFSPFRFIRDREIQFGVYQYPRYGTENYKYYSRKQIRKLVPTKLRITELHGYIYNFIPRYMHFAIHLIEKVRMFRFIYTWRTNLKDARAKKSVYQENDRVNNSWFVRMLERRLSFITDCSYHYVIILKKYMM